MLPEITAAIQSIKVGVEITRGFYNLKTEYEIKTATSDLLDSIIDVQNNLLLIQSSYQSALDDKKEIEDELSRLKNWEKEKDKYFLKQISPGVFVYIIKDNVEPDKQYWLCTNCFDTKNQKSILQRKYPNHSDFICNNCKATIACDV